MIKIRTHQLKKLIVSIVFFVLFLSFQSVQAHTEETTSDFTIGVYVLIMSTISVIVALALYVMKKFETEPGTLPMKKLVIAGSITMILNTIIIAYLYREVLF